jgi:hypothetical protein
MSNAPRYPTSLRISESAKEHIRSVIRTVESCNPGVSFIAEIHWATAYRGAEKKSGPSISVRERLEVPDDCIQVVDGLDLVANLHASSSPYFENKTLDYANGRLVLVQPI